MVSCEATREAPKLRLLVIATARSEMDTKLRSLEAAEAARAAAAAAEIKARARWREAQQATDTAREDHAAAEREISRNAARISALKEAKQRTSAGRDEAVAGRAEAEQALRSLNVPTELIVYPGQFHGFTRPSFIRDRYQRNLDWYDKYLMGK